MAKDEKTTETKSTGVWKKKVNPALAYSLLAAAVIIFVVLIGVFFWW